MTDELLGGANMLKERSQDVLLVQIGSSLFFGFGISTDFAELSL